MKKEKTSIKGRNKSVCKSFLERYEESRRAKRRALRSPWFLYMFMLIPILAGVYLYTKDQFGDEAFMYNDEVYGSISEAIGESIYQVYDENDVLISAGIDEIKLRELVDGYTRVYEDGDSTLSATIKNGYFVAEVTVRLDENYNITATKKNFDSIHDYVNKYNQDLLVRTLIYGVGTWLAVGLFFQALLAIVVKIVKFATRNNSEEKENENEDGKKSEGTKAEEVKSSEGKENEEPKLEVVDGKTA